MVLLEVHFYASTKEHVITFLIAHFVAVLLIVIGLLLIVFSSITIAKKFAKMFMPVLEILFSAILIGVGITILVLYYKENNANIVLILTGSILSIAGIAQGIITLITLKKNKKEYKIVSPKEAKKQASYKEKPVDVDATIENKDKEKQIENTVEIQQIEGPKE